MHIIIGTSENKPTSVLSPDQYLNWGEQSIQQLNDMQDARKYWIENQVGWDKKPGQSPIGELEAKVPVRIMFAYLRAHPDFDYNDDKQFYRFLAEHPEIDHRRKREGHVR